MKLSLAAVFFVSSAWAAGLPAQALPDGPAPQANSAAVPDSPRPQVLPNVASVTPGKGSSASTDVPNTSGDTDAPSLSRSAPVQDEQAQKTSPELKPTLGAGGRVQDVQGIDPEDSRVTLRRSTNLVEIPFTVKDKKGQLVPGLTWRDVQVYENGVRKHMSLWTVDPYPLSVAFVIDQTLPFQVMKQVNMSLGAISGAFSPYDEMAVYTYANGVSQRTTFTGAQSARLSAVLEQSKSSGREMVYVSSGPLSQNVNLNGNAQQNMMPLTGPTHGTSLPGKIENPEKEYHPLYDAIFESAKSLSRTAKGRRRIIYVVSDGKESGSKIHRKELLKYLETNRIAVYATVVGDSATPYVGFLDKYHIPFTPLKENVLPQLASATGGESISEFRVKGIETSFSHIANDVRLQYTVGYYSNEPLTDGKYRTVEVRVLKPDLDVVAKKGYYPSPEALRDYRTVPNSVSSK